MNKVANLIHLAKDGSEEGRSELAQRTASQFLSQAREFSKGEIDLFSLIYDQLYAFATNDVRRRLAATLSMSEWAPTSLLRKLASDEIEIAGNVISFSPNLDDNTLVEIIESCGFDHQILIAKRHDIGEIVTTSLINIENEKLIQALSDNRTAIISPDSILKAIKICENNQYILSSFGTRSDLTNELLSFIYEKANEETKSLISANAPPNIKNQLRKSLDTKLFHAEPTQTTRQTIFKPVQISNINELTCQINNGNKDAFIYNISSSLQIDAQKIKSALEKSDIIIFALLGRAIGLDAKNVERLKLAIQNNESKWEHSDNREVFSTWIKYSPEQAREALLKYI